MTNTKMCSLNTTFTEVRSWHTCNLTCATSLHVLAPCYPGALLLHWPASEVEVSDPLYLTFSKINFLHLYVCLLWWQFINHHDSEYKELYSLTCKSLYHCSESTPSVSAYLMYWNCSCQKVTTKGDVFMIKQCITSNM